MKIDEWTGEVIDELAPIRARIDSLNGERWAESKMSHRATDVVTVDMYGYAFVVCENAGENAPFISKAPDDIRLLLGRLDRVEAFLNSKRAELAEARREQRWEYSKGRIMSGIAAENRADRLEILVNELEEGLNG